MMRAAAYGKLGRHKEAEHELLELLDDCPRFKLDYSELLRRIFLQPEHVDHLLEGLRAAGFKA